MALAQIIDLDERRRRSRPQGESSQLGGTSAPMWCFVWMPVYFWYVA